MSLPSVKPIDFQIFVDKALDFPKCGYCKTETETPIVQKYYLNEKISFCSIRCFELYSSEQKKRKLSIPKEYTLTPHPKDLKTALEKKDNEDNK